ncbi:MAG: 4-(cytidine 5'-diphospho)-2-C-methyl-D-erythritol kinase [Pseudomonadota bacterium]
MTATIFAPIKINIALHVGPVRPDGYHPVDTLCVFPAIGDVLTYERDAPMGMDFAGPFAGPLADTPLRSNLVWRAFGALGIPPEGRFLLNKQVPVASGVGAGTADGVAAMLLLNAVLDLGLDADDLVEASLDLGADGPVCMAGQIAGGGLWRAQGIGERVTRLGHVEPQAMLVVNPGIPVSTAQVFRLFDDHHQAPLRPIPAHRGHPLRALLQSTENQLEHPARLLAPAIGDFLSALDQQPGAVATRMSGSGATCYALHTSSASAERAARVWRSQGLWAAAAPVLAG